MAAKSTKKKKRKPLTLRVHEDLIKNGAATTDAIARRVRAKSRAVGKALSAKKRAGKLSFATRNGEAVWRSRTKRVD